MKLSILTFALAAFATISLGQETYKPGGSVMRLSEAPDDVGYQTIGKLDSATVNYYCYGPSRRSTAATLTVSTITSANPGAVTITTHGFNANATPLVRITGGTGAWTAVNGNHILTYSDANTMLIDVNTTGFAAFAGQTLTVTTYAVRESDALFAIKKLVFNGTPAFIWSGWASDLTDANSTSGLLGGRAKMEFACSLRASYGFQ